MTTIKTLNNMAHPGGRPTEYSPDVCDKAIEYLALCGREQTRLPKLTEFYRFIGISAQCADEWKDKHPEFGEACKKISDVQQEELIDDGLFGGKEVNASMAIFLLKVNHGMVETEKKIFAGDESSPIKIDINTMLQKVYGDESSSS